MGRYLLGGRYLWLLLQRLGKGLKRCAEELVSEGLHQDTEVGALITDGLGLAQYHVHVLHLTPLVLEVVIAQGPSLLLQDIELTTPFLKMKGMQTTRDQQEKIQSSEIVAVVVGRILIGMTLIRLAMVIGMPRKLHTILMKHDHDGGLHLNVHQDHFLALDLGLLIYHQGPADKSNARYASCRITMELLLSFLVEYVEVVFVSVDHPLKLCGLSVSHQHCTLQLCFFGCLVV